MLSLLCLTDIAAARYYDYRGLKMDIETITKLLDAGYTKSEIDAMASANEGATSEASSENNETPREVESNDSAKNESALAPELAEMVSKLTETVSGLSATVKALQETNANKAATDKPAKDKIGDVMKSFIDTL